jgi:hypothetical protein
VAVVVNLRLLRHAGNEPVAPAGDGLDAAIPAASLVQHAPQRRDLYRQVVRLNGDAGPDRIHDRVLRHDRPGAFQQNAKYVQRARANRHRQPVAGGIPAEQPAGTGLQAEAPEHQTFAGGRVHVLPQ